MKLTKEELLEILDYINHLDKEVGLTPSTLLDIDNCILKYVKKIKKK